MAAELDGALQILQTDELDGARKLALACKMQVFIVADAIWLASQSVHTADEPPAGIGADELDIVVIPGIRNRGTIRHNENAFRLAVLSWRGKALAKVIGGKSLAETRLRVP